MTKIIFYKKNGVYYGFKEQGHSGFEDSGKDIVCASISAMTMLLINTIEVALGSDVDYVIDEDTTDIEVIAKGALNEYEQDERINFAVPSLLLGYYIQLNDMLEDYYDYLDVGEIERDI